MKDQIKFIVPCFLTIKKYKKNTAHEEVLDTSTIVKEKRNLTAETGNGHKYQQDRKKNSEQEKHKKTKQRAKKRKSFVLLGDNNNS